MRLKGFFKEYWENVFMPSISWMRKFWLPYSILLVVSWILAAIYVTYKYIGLDNLKSLFVKRTDEEDVEFFN